MSVVQEKFTAEDTFKHPAAWGATNWMNDPSVVLLQDPAAMNVLCEQEMGALEREMLVSLLEKIPTRVRLGITQYHLLDSLDRSRDNKQQELTSLILETPLPQRDSCNRLYRTVRSVGKQANRLFVQQKASVSNLYPPAISMP